MDTPEKKGTSPKRKAKLDITKYCILALITFITFCCCVLFFFLIYRYHGFTEYFDKFMTILQPFIIGFIIAYLINPVMMFLDAGLKKVLTAKLKSERKARKMSRSFSSIGALLFLLLIIFLLLSMMIPELVESIRNMMQDLPAEINNFTEWIQNEASREGYLAEEVGLGIINLTEFMKTFMSEQILPRIQEYVASITVGVVSGVKGIFNFLIGLIIAYYILVTKETFIGQGKKLVYTIFPSEIGNKIIDTARVSHGMFGGFISGKILDSLIIGVLCYIGLIILRMPYSLLVAVTVGVTNIIPFFGPFIGAVPSFVLIFLADPIKGLYFLIFVLLLQQFDGNILGPKILGDSTGLSSFWVMFAILVGGGLFGFMGMLLGVPTFAVIYYLIREIAAYVLRRKKLPEKTIDYIKMKDVDLKNKQLRYEIDKEEQSE